jgi:hypothetical protein
VYYSFSLKAHFFSYLQLIAPAHPLSGLWPIMQQQYAA